MGQRLRLGMIGGGPGSFIGPVHRIAAELDRHIELVAGAFSRDPERSVEAAELYSIEPDRCYPDHKAMLLAERERSGGIDLVAVVTPNHVHFEHVRDALLAGYPVICDKPLTRTLAEARELTRITRQTGLSVAVSYTYSGYPLVREARRLARNGDLGTIRKVVAEYHQGWLATRIEDQGSKQAGWRTDPALAGAGGAISDIGVHAFHIAEFVTGLSVTHLFADLGSVVEGRRLDDDCSILLRFENGARGVLLASQIAFGELNGLRLRIYGDKGAIDWRQELPNELIRHHDDGRTELIRTGSAGLGPDALNATRLPGGHPEGYLEAFANIYRDFAQKLSGMSVDVFPFPDIEDGLRGMAFIETAVSAEARDGKWVRLVARGEE